MVYVYLLDDKEETIVVTDEWQCVLNRAIPSRFYLTAKDKNQVESRIYSTGRVVRLIDKEIRKIKKETYRVKKAKYLQTATYLDWVHDAGDKPLTSKQWGKILELAAGAIRGEIDIPQTKEKEDRKTLDQLLREFMTLY